MKITILGFTGLCTASFLLLFADNRTEEVRPMVKHLYIDRSIVVI